MSKSPLPVADTLCTPTTESGLCAKNLYFTYGKGMALENINLSVTEGEFVSLLGTSGSGKTTLLRLLAGLEKPSSGRISWRGTSIHKPSLGRGIVFQEYSLFPWMRLRDNVALAIAQTQPTAGKGEVRELASKYLEMVGLGDAQKKYPHELSGGMRQRGAIARTFALNSPVLLMDEPFGALDPANRLRLQKLLMEIWSETSPRRTVVFVTHDIDEALILGDRVIIMGSSPGRIIGSLQVNFSRPRSISDLRSIRAEISEYYHRDVLSQIDESPDITHGEAI